MTPLFLIDCRPSTHGWVGFVELGERERAGAAAPSKESLLEELTRIVARHTGLPPRSFELVERPDPRQRASTRPSRQPARPSWRPPSLAPGSLRAERKSEPPALGWLTKLL